jgi:hypothetical protein
MPTQDESGNCKINDCQKRLLAARIEELETALGIVIKERDELEAAARLESK